MRPDPLEALRLPIVPVQPSPGFVESLLGRIRGGHGSGQQRDVPTVRYYVDDIDTALEFYCGRLEFELELRGGAVFAMLYRRELRLLLSTPEPHRLPDGTMPTPGGWNRISLRVEDLAGTVEALGRRGVAFRTPITSGPAVDTVLIEDPAGNLVELFEARSGYHERGEDT